jgi:hypothetical protein
MNFRQFILIYCIGLFVTGCTSWPNEIEEVLKASGSNRKELERVLDYYKGDSIKFQAAYFLIKSMPGKGFVEYVPVNAYGEELDFDIFKYSDEFAIKKAKREFEKAINSPIYYKLKMFHEDIKEITADLLIENIEYAFKAWGMPWAKHVNFEQFCETILPYRWLDEPLANWRKSFFENNQWVISKIKNPSDLINICTWVNDSIECRYGWRHEETLHYPGALTLEQIEKIAGGRCSDLNVVTGYWMRSIGIPVMPESTPFLSNRNTGGHEWLTLLDNDGKFVPFNAAFDNPQKNGWPFHDSRVAKSFRYYYENKPEPFFTNLKKKGVEIPDFFNSMNYRDHTTELVPSKDVEINLDETSNAKAVYLAILNGKEWNIIDWAEVKGGNKAKFSNLGLEAFYLPVYYEEGFLVAAASPFLLEKDGKVKELTPDFNNITSIPLDISKRYWWLRKDRQYALRFWNKGKWMTLACPLCWDGEKWDICKENCASDQIVANRDSVWYKYVPENVLLRFENLGNIQDIGSYGRPFVFDTAYREF